MRLSIQIRLQVLEDAQVRAAIPAGLTTFYADPANLTAEEAEQTAAIRRKILTQAYPNFCPVSGDPLDDRGRQLLETRF